jgi:outer membrane protein TolC
MTMPIGDLFPRNARELFCVLTFLVAFDCAGFAQDVLTQDRCLTLARENNPRTRLAANAVRAAELSLSELRKTALPQISAAGTATYAPVPPKSGYDPAITDGGQLAGQIVVRQSIYDAGIRGLKSDQMRLEMERAAREQDLVGQELTFAVKQTYTEAVRAQEELALRLQSHGQLAAYGELVRRLYNGGSANYADVLKAEMHTAMAWLAVEKARESLTTARFSLSELIGILVDSTARFSSPGIEISTPATDTSTPTRSLELDIARVELEKRALEIQLASHESLPALSLVADAGYLSSGDNLRLPRTERLNTWGYSVGLGLEIPILNWGATRLRVQQKELAVDDLRLQMELLQRSLSTEVRKILLQLSLARARLRTLRETIRKSEENFLLTKSRYAGGGTLASEVFAAQQLMTDTKMDELQTSTDICLLAARLERLTVHEQQPARP